MLSPRPSLVLKTLLFVFVAALCLWCLAPSARVPEKSAAPSSLPTPLKSDPNVASRSTSSAPTSVSSNDPAETSGLAKFTFATLWGREKNPALAAFSRWATRYTNASPSEKSAMLPLGVTLARERRAAFKNLIQTQPKAALAQTVPALIRNELPSSVTSLLEERVTGQGDLLILGRTDARGTPPIVRRAVVNSTEYDAFVYGDRASQRTHSNLSLHGVALDGQLALSDS